MFVRILINLYQKTELGTSLASGENMSCTSFFVLLFHRPVGQKLNHAAQMGLVERFYDIPRCRKR